MTLTNKHLVKKLIEYFLTQDPETVGRILANTLLDHHRMLNYTSLPDEEVESLDARIRMNEEVFLEFAKTIEEGREYIEPMCYMNMEYVETMEDEDGS